jgi:hypothetical protein
MLFQKENLADEKEVSREIEQLIVEYCYHVQGRETHLWCFIILLIRILFSLVLQPSAGCDLLGSRGFLITHNDAPQSVGPLRTSDQPVAETST